MKKYSNGVGVTHYLIPYADDLNGFTRRSVKYGVSAENVSTIITSIINNPDENVSLKEVAKKYSRILFKLC